MILENGPVEENAEIVQSPDGGTPPQNILATAWVGVRHRLECQSESRRKLR